MRAFPKPKEIRRKNKKPRQVDGHDAVIHRDWSSVRREILQRSGGYCECGCGISFLTGGLELHHWRGRTRGNRCDCAFHLQGLLPEHHRAAHKHRLGAPYRSKA
jgi:hypothetical protein